MQDVKSCKVCGKWLKDSNVKTLLYCSRKCKNKSAVARKKDIALKHSKRPKNAFHESDPRFGAPNLFAIQNQINEFNVQIAIRREQFNSMVREDALKKEIARLENLAENKQSFVNPNIDNFVEQLLVGFTNVIITQNKPFSQSEKVQLNDIDVGENNQSTE